MCDLSDTSKSDIVREINPVLLRSLSLKTENNLDDVIIVIVDPQMEISKDCQLLKDDLQSIIYGSVHHFTDLDSSLTFIQANQEIKIFLIISGSFGEMHGHHFFQLPQIVSIYVFCYDRLKHHKWAHIIEKIRDVFEDKTQLLTAVSRDVKNLACRWSFLDERSFQKASTNDGRWYQLFIRILIHQPQTKNSWGKMLNEFRLFFKQDSKRLQDIDNFEKNYHAHKALDYYCQDSFVYRVVNYALRTHDINIIVKFQPYISDLYNQLQTMFLHYNIDVVGRKTIMPVRVVYRGQYMQEAELKQLKD